MFALLTRKAAAFLPDLEKQTLEEFGEAKGRRILLLTRIFFAALSIPCALFAGLLLGKLLWANSLGLALLMLFLHFFCFLYLWALRTPRSPLSLLAIGGGILMLIAFYFGMAPDRYYAFGRFLFPGL